MFDPLTIILLVIFVVLPLVNGLLKGQQQQPQRPRTPGTPQTPQARRPGTARPTVAGPSAGDDEFARRLEEARRRVQDAMGADTTVRRDPTASLPEERPLGGPPAPRRDTEFQDPVRRPPSPAAFDHPGTRIRAQQDVKTAPPLRVQRGSSQKPAKLSQESLLRFDTDAVFRGVLWHQILSEPRSKKPLGRNQLRQRSR